METRAGVFGDDQDLLAYLRDVVARPDAHPEVGSPAPSGLEALEAEARASGHADRLADAALSLLETGNDAERAAVQDLAVHAAPDAVRRLRALLARPELPAGVRVRCASELLVVSRDDPAGLAALREALAGPGDHRRALLAAARHLPEWPAEGVRLAPPDDELLLALWKETPVSKRRAFVEAVVATGADHHHALIAGARQLVRRSREQAAPLMKMLAPHLPDPTSGEIVVEAMLGSLRSNRKDPQQAELAERLLRRHDIWPKKPESDD
jgi:hypothetical protein